ncbi:MAG: SPASM domain-containing protein, partial [Brevinematia bacterium]
DVEYENNLFGRIPNPKIFIGNSPEELVEAVESVKDEKVVITWNSTTVLDLSLLEALYRKRGEVIFIANLPEYMEFEVWDTDFLLEVLKNHQKLSKPIRSVLSSTELDEAVYFTDVLEKDIRLYRWEISPFSYKGEKLAKTLSEKIDFTGGVVEQIENILRASPELLTEIPTFYCIEISSERIESVYNSTWELSLTDMALEKFREVISRIVSYSKTAGIMIGIFNEPLFNKNIGEILRVIDEYRGYRLSFILNTSLTLLPEELVELFSKTKEVRGFRDTPFFSIFVDIPSNQKNEFEKLKRANFEDVISNLRKLLDIDPSRVFIKFVRSIYNDDSLPSFYNEFKGYNILIQRCQMKGLNPVDTVLPYRIPCYKIQTTLVILPDGTSTLCVNDTKLERVIGNVFSENLDTICSSKAKTLREHFCGKFLGICKNCVVWDQFDL